MARDTKNTTKLAVMETDIKYIKNSISSLQNSIDLMDKKLDRNLDDLPKRFVTRTEFTPVKQIVFGAAGFVLVAVLGALLALIAL